MRGEDHSSIMSNKKIQLVDERFGGQGYVSEVVNNQPVKLVAARCC